MAKRKRAFEWMNIDPADFQGSYDFNVKYEEFINNIYQQQQQANENMYRQQQFYGDPFQNFYKAKWDCSDDPVYKQCIADAIEYFTPALHTPMEHDNYRKRLDPELKRRVFEFCKNRMEFYGQNGLLLEEVKK